MKHLLIVQFRRHISILALACFFILPMLMFLGKAVHMDDVPWLSIAEQITRDPLRPYSFLLSWNSVASVAYDMGDPPLVMYYLAIVLKLLGSTEIILHLSFLPFSLLALWAVHDIASRFTKKPLLVTLLTATSPSFFVSATTLMMDIPFLAVTLLGFVCFFRSTEKNSLRWALAAALSIGTASLIKYPAIVPMGILCLGYLFAKKYRFLLWFVLGFATIQMLWNTYFFLIYGTFHILHIRSLATANELFNWSFIAAMVKGPYFLSFLGGSTLVITPLLIAIQERRQRIITILLAMLYAFLPLHHGELIATRSIPNAILIVLFILNGSFLFSWLTVTLVYWIKNGRKDWKMLFLGLWSFSALIIPLVLSPFLTVRYLIFFLVPVSIAAGKAIEERFSKFASVRIIYFFCIFCTLILSLFVAIGDARWANTIRSFVSEGPTKTPEGKTVWYVGHWGLQYYVEGLGKAYIDIHGMLPHSGDWIIIPTNAPQQAVPDLSRSHIVKVINLVHNWPIFTMSVPLHAGWYSHYWGDMPFAVGNGPVETIAIWEFEPTLQR